MLWLIAVLPECEFSEAAPLAGWFLLASEEMQCEGEHQPAGVEQHPFHRWRSHGVQLFPFNRQRRIGERLGGDAAQGVGRVVAN